MRILIRGAGDLASGIGWRLYQAGYRNILMTEAQQPLTVRRTVAFSPAVYLGEMEVEGLKGVLVTDEMQTEAAFESGCVAVIVDPQALCRSWYQPDVIIDAILAKYNVGTKINDAGLVIGVGPGFTAPVDCDCVVETKRGHYLGRVIRNGSAIPNTGIPGNVGGYTTERVIRAGADGVFRSLHSIGDLVNKGEPVCEVTDDVSGEKVFTYALIDGVVRGMLQDGVHVEKNLKSGDIDPRGIVEYCESISDKAVAIGGGVLEAVSGYALEKGLII